MNKFIFCIFLLLGYSLEAYNYQLSIVAITKNEHAYLPEWIDYHKMVGVDHFYIYDNNDDDSLTHALSSYISEGTVELIPWPNHWPERNFIKGCQIYAYRDALNRARTQTKWLAILDTDEFLLPMKEDNLIDTLDRHYSNDNFIYVSWLVFGTSNTAVPLGKPFLSQLTQCAALSNPINNYGKTICRPEVTRDITNVHFAKTHFPYKDGSGKKLRHGTKHQSKYLRINHYMLSDENFLNDVKIPRYANMWGLDLNSAAFVLQTTNRSLCMEKDYRILLLLHQHNKLPH